VPTPETIVAIATPPGIGGVGIVRIAGPAVPSIARHLLGRLTKPRQATLTRFRAADGTLIDQGLALFFPAPHSFTGDDVLELHGHGGPVILDLLVARIIELGARLARPGEFTERAFLNGKLDLTQAEAIADLIASTTATAARLAARTLQGDFSARIAALVDRLIQLRVQVEAGLDFPDDEIDPIAAEQVKDALQGLIVATRALIRGAHQGRLFRDGLKLVIAGPPNAGKSSLMNALSGSDTAIVTPLPGTTRDLLREHIQIDGMPVQLIDTAGLRTSDDPAEAEGIRRARTQIAQADRVLWVFDDATDPDHAGHDPAELPAAAPITWVRNKIDLTGKPATKRETPQGPEIALSARTGEGLSLLREHIRQAAGLETGDGGEFLARRRHVVALEHSESLLARARDALSSSGTMELIAEDLRLAQQALGEITGVFTTDDLLDRVFSSFCLGK
jgi:tRNA modification GTPase